jgi:predicted transcriptional regulator
MTREQTRAVLDRVRTWPDDRQEQLACIALQLEQQDVTPAPEDAATKAAIAEGLAQARRGEFASDQQVADVLKRPWR